MRLCAVCSGALVVSSSVDCSLPGSSVHGICQAIILKWIAMPSSKKSSQPSNWTHISCVSCIAGGLFTHSSIPAWVIPWTRKPRGLYSVGSQWVGHNWAHTPYQGDTIKIINLRYMILTSLFISIFSTQSFFNSPLILYEQSVEHTCIKLIGTSFIICSLPKLKKNTMIFE